MSCRMRSVFFSRKPFNGVCVWGGGGGGEKVRTYGGSGDLGETW